MLCGIGADRDNSLCVWSSASGDWTDGARVALGQGPRRAAMFVAWAAGATSDSLAYHVFFFSDFFWIHYTNENAGTLTLWTTVLCRYNEKKVSARQICS